MTINSIKSFANDKFVLVASVVTLSALVVAPVFLSNFFVFQMTIWLTYAIAIGALNLLTGISGQFSLGQSAFYGSGAYVTAILINSFGVNYLLTIPIAGLVCFVLGFLFGFPALRLKGVYLALATFALATAFPQLAKLHFFDKWTGGVQGLFVAAPQPPFGLPVSKDQWLYYLCLAIALLLYLIAVNLIGSRSGRAMLAIRDNQIAASALGVNISLYKTLAFGMSAAITGIAGALSAVVVQFVAPDSFTIHLSILIFLGMVVGGVGWLPGSLAGAAFIILVPNIAEEISKGLSGAVFGVILILFVYLLPKGFGQVATWLRTILKGQP